MADAEQFTSTVQSAVTLHGGYGRFDQRYAASYSLSPASTGLRPDGWLWRYLQQVARNTDLTPLHSSTARELALALEEARLVKSWKTLDAIEAGKVTKDIVWSAFTDFEEALLSNPLGGATTCAMSRELRKFCLRAVELQQKGLAGIVRASFKTRLKHTSTPRPLISQLPGLDASNVPRHPLDALAHESLSDLRKKQRALLEGDLRKVEEACENQFSAHYAFVSRLEKTLNLPVTAEELDLVGSSTLWTKTERGNEWFDKIAPDPLHLASIYLRLIQNQSADSRPVLSFRLCRVGLIREKLIEIGAVESDSPENPFRTYLFGDTDVRTACTLALQASTGWNCSAVLALTTDRVVGSEPPFTIQGYKSKTGSEAPPCIVEASETAACLAIQFLMQRLAAMKRMNIVSPDETQLWINPSNIKSISGRASTYVSYPSDLKSFQLKHRLPLFSPDQVRAQVLAIRSDLGSVPEEARQTAGHLVIDTTAGYLQQEILKALHSASNLKFQRKLEESTDYEATFNGHEEDRDIEASLFYPIGDGSSCRDAKKPPNASYMKDGFCSGQSCHTEDGCENRRIVLNKARVFENWTQVQFYKRNWKDLLSAYPEQFKRLHLPAMTFAIALGEVISRGPLAGHQKLLTRNEEGRK